MKTALLPTTRFTSVLSLCSLIFQGQLFVCNLGLHNLFVHSRNLLLEFSPLSCSFSLVFFFFSWINLICVIIAHLKKKCVPISHPLLPRCSLSLTKNLGNLSICINSTLVLPFLMLTYSCFHLHRSSKTVPVKVTASSILLNTSLKALSPDFSAALCSCLCLLPQRCSYLAFQNKALSC